MRLQELRRERQRDQAGMQLANEPAAPRCGPAVHAWNHRASMDGGENGTSCEWVGSYLSSIT